MRGCCGREERRRGERGSARSHVARARRRGGTHCSPGPKSLAMLTKLQRTARVSCWPNKKRGGSEKRSTHSDCGAGFHEMCELTSRPPRTPSGLTSHPSPSSCISSTQQLAMPGASRSRIARSALFSCGLLVPLVTQTNRPTLVPLNLKRIWPPGVDDDHAALPCHSIRVKSSVC